jgi:hypothetical protein
VVFHDSHGCNRGRRFSGEFPHTRLQRQSISSQRIKDPQPNHRKHLQQPQGAIRSGQRPLVASRLQCHSYCLLNFLLCVYTNSTLTKLGCAIQSLNLTFSHLFLHAALLRLKWERFDFNYILHLLW